MNEAVQVLLVEDDPSIQRYVRLALEDLPVRLQLATTVAQALELLRQQPVALILLDLMLPDAPGADLLRRLADEPALRGAARQVIFSAGLNAAARAALSPFDIAQVLSKPASLSELRACVLAAFEPGSDELDDRDDAIHRYFGGDRALFADFRRAALAQFEEDMRQGDEASAQRDGVRLRRLAHSLHTVLQTLGLVEAARHAAALEAASAEGASEAPALWAPLRAALARTTHLQNEEGPGAGRRQP